MSKRQRVEWRPAEKRVEAWIVSSRGGPVAAFQREVWRAWGSGESGLIYAPTGSDKTLAALGGPMIEAIARGVQPNHGLTLLLVTPLRALAADLIVQLEAPLKDLGIPWRVLRRTGDSGRGERARLKAGRVEVLVTHPKASRCNFLTRMRDRASGLSAVLSLTNGTSSWVASVECCWS